MEIMQHQQSSSGKKVQHAKSATGEKCKTKKVKLEKMQYENKAT